MLLTGCASYQASMLGSLPIEEPLQNNNVMISWKKFDEKDSETYLGRNLIAEGFVPVQMTIRNHSTDPMYLSPNNFSIQLPPVYQVAEKVHTSTAGRVLGWGIPGLALWPLLIPAVYDGIQSKEANRALNMDYLAKSIKEQTIQPHSSFNGVVFVPKDKIGDSIELFLVNQRTNEKISYTFNQ